MDDTKINVSLLESYEQDFNNEKSNFENSTYSTFSSSYFGRCSDPYVSTMNSKLTELYDKIKKGYNNIDSWWQDYNLNIKSLENLLSTDERSGTVSDESTQGYVNSKLPTMDIFKMVFSGVIASSISAINYPVFSSQEVKTDLEDFKKNFSDYLNSNNETMKQNASKVEIEDTVEDSTGFWENASKTITSKISEVVKDTGSKISTSAESVVDAGKEKAKEFSNWLESDDGGWYERYARNVLNTVNKTGATIATFETGLGEGFVQFGGALTDTVAICGTVRSSVYTAKQDISRAVVDKKFRQDLLDGNAQTMTGAMWGKTRSFVEKEFVKDFYDKHIYSSAYGSYLKGNSFAFDFNREISNGVGYIAGIVTLTVATFGVGGAVAGGGAATTTASTSVYSTTIGTASINVTAGNLASGGIATVAGFGKNTGAAWRDGAATVSGLAYGTVAGAWEGIEMTFGSVINSLKLGIGKGVVGSIINSGSHIILDSIDGGTAGIVQPALSMLYSPNSKNMEEIMQYVNYDSNGNKINNRTWNDLSAFEKYNALFEHNGGWETVTQGAMSAGLFSTASEALPALFGAAKKKIVNAGKNVATFNNIDQVSSITNSKIMSSSDFNKKNLINGIIDEIPNDVDEVTKARIIYLKLNQSVGYSDNFFALQDVTNDASASNIMKSIYSGEIDISNMESNKIVCSNWSDMYKNLLEESGIDSSKIKVVSAGTSDITHKYISVELDDGKLLVADGTTSFSRVTDLNASKFGQETKGFIITTKEQFENARESFGAKTSGVFALIDSSENSQLLKNIDNSIGYSNSQYKQEFDNIISTYSNDKLKIPVEEKINTFTKLVEKNNMSSVDAIGFAQNYANNILGSSSDVAYKLRDGNTVLEISFDLEPNQRGYLIQENGENFKFYNSNEHTSIIWDK